jgi:hypothetical protein
VTGSCGSSFLASPRSSSLFEGLGTFAARVCQKLLELECDYPLDAMWMALRTLSQFESTHATATVPVLVRTRACHRDCRQGLPNLRCRLATLPTSPPARPFAPRARRSALSTASDSQALTALLLFGLLKQMIAVDFVSQCLAGATRSPWRIPMGISLWAADRTPYHCPATLFAHNR